MVEALINVCSKIGFSFVDYLHPHVCALLQEFFFQSLHQILCLTTFTMQATVLGPNKALGATSWLWSQIWRFYGRCWSLSLKLSHPTLILRIFIVLRLVFLLKNVQGGCLTMSKLTTCINIMHSFNSLYCMLHTILS